ncbi:hypothetical protein O181_096751 [Austropuccinia psidii MF-1]|uniref:Uncharacterized protein n=1 Tax=Austropuccinia psidii MF-1 TaxID=1389203 RepID=A0A9Q3J7N6_9BASI|nr:hypothetical protein [Austropuccinia psidii MF-1]
MVDYMIHMATTSTLHSAFCSSLTQPEYANAEIERAKKEKRALLKAVEDSKDGLQSDEEERVAEIRCWEEHTRLEQEFPNDQYLQEAGYAKDGGKIG